MGVKLVWLISLVGGYGAARPIAPHKKENNQSKPTNVFNFLCLSFEWARWNEKEKDKWNGLVCEWAARNGMKWVCFLFHSFMNDGKQMNANGMKWANAAPSWPTQRGKSLPSTLLSLRLSMESQQRKGWVVGLLSLFFQLGLPAAPHFLQSLRDCWLVSLPAQLRSHANQHSALLRGPTQKEELELLLAKNIITNNKWMIW